MDGMDLTSKLPESILEHILSFLVVEDAAKTSVLSKVWYNAWTSLSCLDFGDKVFEESKAVIFQILASRKKSKTTVKKFRLELPFSRSTSSDVDNMIKLLVACNIKKFSLAAVAPIHGYHKLGKALFAAKALNVLKLDGFKLELPSDGIKFSSLRELRLVESFLDDELLQALCSSCSALEVLCFQKVDGLTSLHVAGTLPKLRIVKLDFCPPQFHNVDIVAANLTDLHIVSCQGELDVIKITACKSLKRLALKGVAVTDEWVVHLFSCLPNLEFFFLVNCSSLKTVKISSDRLTRLTVIACDNLTTIDLNTPNLERFSCSVYYGKERSLNGNPLTTFKLKASHLLEACLQLKPETIDTDWYYKLTESLGNFNHSKAIELRCIRDEVIVIPKGIRENLLPPLHGTKHLHIYFQNHVNHSVVDVVDSLLWASPQLETLSIALTRDVKTLKFIYRDAIDEDEKPCCESLSLKCWRHNLEKVKMQNFAGVELQNLKSYFFANANIVAIVEVSRECSI